MPAKTQKQLKALKDLSLRQSSDKTRKSEEGATEPNPLYDEWFNWPAGTVFDPPAHMDVKLALQRGIVEEVTNG